MGVLKARVSGAWLPVDVSDAVTLEGRVTLLETKVAALTPTAWVNPTLLNGWLGTARYRAVGDDTELYFTLNHTNPIPATPHTLFSIPVGLAPSVNTGIHAFYDGEGAPKTTALTLQTNGDLRYNGATGAATVTFMLPSGIQKVS